MKETNNKEILKKTRMTFWINVLICALSTIILFYSLASHEMWRITASSIGFLVFLSLAVLVFRKMMKLEK